MRNSRLLASILTLLVAGVLPACAPDQGNPESGREDGGRWERKRARLVDSLEKKGIEDARVLGALRAVPRHRFVPPSLAEFAYDNGPLEIGQGQTISSPFVVGIMTQLLHLRGDERVLEIGTGSGYQAAVLAEIVPEVYTIEIRPALAHAARERLSSLGYDRVRVRCGDGFAGWPEEAPFDAIIVTAAPEEVPEALVGQMANGGRLLVPIGTPGENQMLVLVRKDAKGEVTFERDLPVRLAPMIRDRWATMRERLVSYLEEERGIHDEKVLRALETVPRHRFVPADEAEQAYENRPLPIGEGQTISSPYIVAFMTQILELRGDEKVLEIGTGSGYQAAVLAEIVPRVFTIEIREGLAKSAAARLAEMGYDGVAVRCGDGYKGWPEEAPFDAIIVTAAPEDIPEALVDQLARGGRLIVPVGPQTDSQELILVRRGDDGAIAREAVLPVRFVPMIREK